MTMDQLRIGDAFNITLVDEPVTIIGCGALGSAVALQLAKLGCVLRLIDFDVVESHNIPNQLLFGVKDVGEHKSRVLCERLTELTGLPHQFSTRAVSEDDHLDSRFIFACVDSMAARRMIFDAISDNDGLFLEGRIGAYDYSTYCVQRASMDQMQNYDASIYSDDEVVADRAACGTIMSIGATASLAANTMVWQFMQACMGQAAPNFVTGSVRTWLQAAFRWNPTGANLGMEVS